MFREKEHKATSGVLVLLVGLLMILASVAGLIQAASTERPVMALVWALIMLVSIVLLSGLFTGQPITNWSPAGMAFTGCARQVTVRRYSSAAQPTRGTTAWSRRPRC
jgi:hypothetical protein